MITTTDGDVIHPEYDNVNIIYAAANAFDASQTVTNILIVTVLEYNLKTKVYGHCIIKHTKNLMYEYNDEANA
ncbi:MAG: hypothetical protein JO297_18700 [Nitrososphaeraceae archaeon]|nr:hypothetical protein [Nitrososphaeraceae archaeon]